MKKWILALSMVSLLWVQPMAVSAASKESAAFTKQMEEVHDIIQYYHVNEPDQETMSDEAIRAMVDSLNDPYSQYLTQEQWNSFQSAVENTYVGIGVKIEQGEHGVAIVEVFQGSPAEEAGLQAGDIFTKVDQESVTGFDVNELTSKVTGPENSEVIVSVKREDEELTYTVKRKQVQIPVIKQAYFDQAGIGYVRLYSFSQSVDEEVAEALQAMESRGLNALVLDVRGNGGGLLDSTMHIAELFVDSGVLIHTKIRGKQGTPVKITEGRDAAYPVTILVDGGSASASEVLAGALRDHGVAKLVGTQTFGKGSVQQIFQLSNGGYLKLTVEEYLTPKMHPVNHVGLQPSSEVHGSAAQLLTALHQAGLEDMIVTVDRGIVSGNDIRFEDTVGKLEEQGSLYAPVRFLAALVQADVAWDGKSKSIKLAKGQQQLNLSTSASDLRMIAGTTYMDISAFESKFGGLTWEHDDEGVLTFKVIKES